MHVTAFLERLLWQKVMPHKRKCSKLSVFHFLLVSDKMKIYLSKDDLHSSVTHSNMNCSAGKFKCADCVKCQSTFCSFQILGMDKPQTNNVIVSKAESCTSQICSLFRVQLSLLLSAPDL